ncbi:MAG: hypothetical protein P8M55_00280 [Gammaproteobacteria bacterium]|jgi:hypothetical protein|nr:hypothetical protein [Gammaproteobacteria bacterium]MDG2434057.1 hypothetical protein [Gammaproteobacteria bacterium]
MFSNPKKHAFQMIKIAIAFLPWLISLYILYSLDSSGTWTSETAHRGKMSVAILATGMTLSFLIHSYFSKIMKK